MASTGCATSEGSCESAFGLEWCSPPRTHTGLRVPEIPTLNAACEQREEHLPRWHANLMVRRLRAIALCRVTSFCWGCVSFRCAAAASALAALPPTPGQPLEPVPSSVSRAQDQKADIILKYDGGAALP